MKNDERAMMINETATKINGIVMEINEISMKKDPFDTHVNNAVTEIKKTLTADGHEAGNRLEAKHMAAINNITQSHYDKYSDHVGHDNHQKKFDNAVFDGTDLFT